MKLDVTQTVKDTKGEPLVIEGRLFDLRFILKETAQAVRKDANDHVIPDDNKKAWRLYQIYLKLEDEKSKEVDLTSEDIQVLKEKLPYAFPHIVLRGQVLKLMGEKG